MHDRNGTELKVGDIVLIPGTIVEVQPNSEFCNCLVELSPMRGSNVKESGWYNTGQVVLHGRVGAAR